MSKIIRLLIQFIIVILSISLIFESLAVIGVDAASGPPSLELSTPVINGYSVTVNGITTPGTSGATISRINWNWGDGSSGDSWFEATHSYSNSGTYTITVISYQSDGLTTTKTTQATISGTASSRPTMTAKSITSTSNVDSVLRSAGLPADVQIIKVNVNGSISLSDPLIILGSGIDAMENQLFQAATANYGVNSSHILNDKTPSYNGKDIESYDLVVVGGSGHNAYTKELIDRGVLRYNATSLKSPGLLVEMEKLPTGHTVVVVASIAGYPYQEKSSLDANSLEPSTVEATPSPEDSYPTSADMENAKIDLMNSMLAVEERLSHEFYEHLPSTISQYKADRLKSITDDLGKAWLEYQEIELDYAKKQQRLSEEAYNKLTDEEKAKYDELYQQNSVNNDMMDAMSNLIKEQQNMNNMIINTVKGE